MLIELIQLQSTLGTTFVYVTHNQFEALTVADHMAIMNANGDIEQIGTPKEIYEFPISSFVAKFVGTTNIFSGTLQKQGNTWSITLPDLGDVVLAAVDKPWAKDGGRAIMSIRPEKIEISLQPLTGFSNVLRGVVDAIVYHGRSTQYNVKLSNDMIVQVFEQNEEHFPREVIDYDNNVYLYWQKENVVLLEQ